MKPQVGGTYQIEIAGLSHEGAGVGRLEGLAVFIPGALPGELVEAKLTRLKSKFASAELLKVLKPSASRVEPACSHYAGCGGCQLQHLEYPEQLKQKTRRVRETLIRIGKLQDFKLHETLGMSEPWYYRNKAQLHAGLVEGKLKLGYYSPGTHELVPLQECSLLPPVFVALISGLEKLFNQWRLVPFNRKTGEGTLKHVILKRSRATGEVMVILVTAGTVLPDGEAMAQEILKGFPQIVSVVQNINPGYKQVLGTDFRLLVGAERIKESLGNLEFLISAASFFQVNPEQTEVLYNKALEYAELSGTETVLDLYCGTGTISLFLARKARMVYGIEEVEPAIEDARQNAEQNGITNVEFQAGTVETVLPRLAAKGIKPEVIVLDPPRQGCDRTVLEAASSLKPRRMVYVSCDPGTLARDLGILSNLDYQTTEVQPVDMFPQTYHVECVVSLKRKHSE
ncbi:23S rRNA (uracil(1939)-C(5))-methyltransferase RlmD [Zhaonella formicivorans]|uniref:23S rRNA (uracil(1939)-C(5))-methyltransferase RlmD n=1 Tax=Zhaonella formicivorans TaxID=2528593 RepID=UPI001D10F085|nr:23S rRNA (uracil(1939)-C(5))-methyltransferase RlmD [Zhaonella formicivorans]